VVADEAHFISNFNTAQSKAIVALSPKRYILMSGTIMANYPRNLHPILSIFGDAKAYQPWGYHNGHLSPDLIDDYRYGRRGPKAFMDAFVTIDWCTYEFEDGMIKGAKREIPKIANLEHYREALAPFVKRRVLDEPEVVKYFDLPKLNEHHVFLDWDIDHLAYYIKVAKDFADYWRNQDEDRAAISSLLPRINAIVKASSKPHVPIADFGSFTGKTPKDKYVVDLVEKWVANNEKSILYASSPDSVLRLTDFLEKNGVKCLPYHGKIAHTKRAQLLEKYFKNGDAMCLVATTGCLSEGENLQDHASKVLFFERHWSAKTESQCTTRVYRPGQRNDVEAHYLHYEGGIDCYIKQLVDYKNDCFKSGIDYASPELFESEFLHLDRILGEFVESLPELEKQLLELKRAA
jgi:SNF2 family DNA or RNA helicase